MMHKIVQVFGRRLQQECSAAGNRLKFSCRHLTSNQYRYGKNKDICMASTTATAIDSSANFSAVDEGKRSVESYFPWRSHTPKAHTWDIQHQISRIIVDEWLLNFDSVRHSNSSYMETDFLMGCQQAFKAAMCAIFKHKRIRDAEEALKADVTHHNVKSDAPQTAEICDSEPSTPSIEASDSTGKPVAEIENTFFVPELTEVFEASLGHFYNHAIDTTLRSKFIVHHEFCKVGTPYIEKYDVIFGGKRGRDFTGLIRYNSFGLIPTIGAAEKPSPSILLSDISDGSLPKPVKNLMDMRRYATVRLSVNVPLTEIFYVLDEVTGNIIQGSREPEKTLHNVLFETVLDAREPHLMNDWVICDIDGWLEGNEFWTQSKKSHRKKSDAAHNGHNANGTHASTGSSTNADTDNTSRNNDDLSPPK